MFTFILYTICVDIYTYINVHCVNISDVASQKPMKPHKEFFLEW